MSNIAKVKVLVGNDDISDDLIAFYLDSVEQFVKGYCNIESIPNELKPTLIEITAMRVRANTSSGSASIGEGMQQVTSLSDGNQSIGYSPSQSKAIVSNEDILEVYGRTLDRWRKLVVNRSTSRPSGSRKIE